MTDRPAIGPRSAWVRTWGLAAGLLVILGMVAADFRAKHLTEIEPSTRLEVAAGGKLRPLSVERRDDVVPDLMFRDDDAYYWLAYARAFHEDTAWRVRHTDVDNVPHGREVHWSSGPVWLLAALSAPLRWVGDRSLDEALSTAGLAFHPLLLGGLIVAAGLMMSRRVHPLVAVGLTSAFLLAPVLGRDATYGALDHHLPLLICVFGSLLCLIVGGAGHVIAPRPDLRAEALRRARRWIVASALFAGAGLWLQAAFQILLVGAIVVAGLIAAISPARAGRETTFVPELWRLWGLVGAVTSFGFYLLEYFPSHMGMRLEVNHPLHALALAAGGEAVCRLARMRTEASSATRLRHLPALLVCLLGGLLLPAAMRWGPDGWLLLDDPILDRIHGTIVGFRPASMLFSTSAQPVRVLVREMGVLPLLFLPALYRLVRPRDDRDRLRLLVALVPAVIAGALYVGYVRNAGLFVATLVCLGCAVLMPASNGRTGRSSLIVAALLLVVHGGVWFGAWQSLQRFVGSDLFARDWTTKLAYRDVAQAMRRDVPEGRRVAIVDSALAPAMHYFGDFKVTAGLYWENLDGQKDTVAFFAAQDDAESLAIARRRGARYVVLWAIPPATRRWYYLEHGTLDEEAVRRSLGARLVESRGVPAWLEEVGSRYGPAARDFRIKVFRVRDPTE